MSAPDLVIDAGDPSSRVIRQSRGPRTPVDRNRPAACFCEPEASPGGTIDDVATLFLVNRECPFTCVYCDLWKQTTETSVSADEILNQIDVALASLPACRHIKLYNAGNFFDRQAIPREAWPGIADRVCRFETVIVENHPRLVGPDCRTFRDLLEGAWARGPAGRVAEGPVGEVPGWPRQPPVLEVAMGLESVHPQVWPRLNKQMTPEDFRNAANWLRCEGLESRAFVLLQPPWMPAEPAVDWAVRGIEFALESGSRVVAVIPTRGGNGWLEQLAARGEFTPPTLAQLGEVLRRGLALGRGRVMVDLWDAERLAPGGVDPREELAALRKLNLTQGR